MHEIEIRKQHRRLRRQEIENLKRENKRLNRLLMRALGHHAASSAAPHSVNLV
jgi:hypothetical protein